MSNLPIVSICMPTYGQPDRALKALNSVIQQNFESFEVIITDDTPDDSVYKSVSSFLKDSRFKYFKNQPGLGSPGNWNKAISLASGRYIKILHHDDWLLTNESLGSFVRMLEENPDADFAFSASKNCDGGGRAQYVTMASTRQLKKMKEDPTFLALGNFVGAPSATIYRNSKPIDFDVKLKWLVDVEFYMRILMNNGNFVSTAQPLVGITTGTSNQVTAESYKARDVEIFEAVYLLNKFNSLYGISKYVYFNVWRLFLEFSIFSRETVLDCGLAPEQYTQSLKDIIYYQRIYRPLISAVNLMKTLLSPTAWIRLILKNVAFRSSKIKGRI